MSDTPASGGDDQRVAVSGPALRRWYARVMSLTTEPGGRALRAPRAAAMILALACGCQAQPSGSTSGLITHCNDDLGNVTCEANHPGKPYCSLCVEAENDQGCVSSLPAPACRPDGGSGPGTSDTGSATTGGVDESSGSSSTTGSGSTTGTTGPATCEGDEGTIDPACEAEDPMRPYCVAGSCVGCAEAGGQEFCTQIDPQAPACDDATGLCKACGEADAAVCTGATPVCDTGGACVACETHAECPDTACHLSPADPLLGACFGTDEVIWVDNDNICPGMGTEASPACSLAQVVAGVQSGESAVIRLAGAGGAYAEQVTVDAGITVAILGSSTPDLGGDPNLGGSSLVVDDAIVYLHSVRLSDNADEHGLSCAEGVVVMQESEARSNAEYGVYTTGPCDITVDRATIYGNTAGGLRQLGGTLRLVNTAVGLNGDGGSGPGINVQLAQLEVLYSTIAGNDGVGGDSIHCLDATGSVRNSILTGTSIGSVDLDCFPLMFDHSAIDTQSFAGGTNTQVGAYNAAWFANPATGNFQLSATGEAIFMDVALWMDGDPPTDADGTPRPMGGTPGFPGIDEP